MTLAESLLYSGLSASFTIFCWLVRFAWKRWRKKTRVVRPADDEAAAAPDDELGREVKDVPFSICGNVMKGVGESAIDALVDAHEDESRRRCRCCRCLCCCPPCQ